MSHAQKVAALAALRREIAALRLARTTHKVNV